MSWFQLANVKVTTIPFQSNRLGDQRVDVSTAIVASVQPAKSFTVPTVGGATARVRRPNVPLQSRWLTFTRPADGCTEVSLDDGAPLSGATAPRAISEDGAPFIDRAGIVTTRRPSAAARASPYRAFATSSSLFTAKTPLTSRALISARRLSERLSTTPNSVVRPPSTMMWIG